MERTFAIIKPDAVAKGATGKIIDRMLDEGFKILGMRLTQLSLSDAEGFYAVHRERPFFGELTEFMSSGPCVVFALEREDAIAHWRKVIGDTNPENAAEGTIRKQFAENIGNNAVHGSDAPETAAIEISYFFRDVELV